MAIDRVLVERQMAAAPGAVWSIVREFSGHWHPAIAEMRLERDAMGAQVRAFTAKGESTLYRERLTWFSDSERSLAYTHLEGIAGARAYDAVVSVSPAGDGGSLVTWTAEVEADEPRLSEIVRGTGFIFNTGLDALEELASGPLPPQAPTSALPTASATTTRMLEGNPRLALSVAGASRGRQLALYLHGIGGGRGNWSRQIEASAALMPSAALDLRGYGESALGPAQSTVDDHCADILRVMELFQAERLVLVGLSYGAWLATSFAMRHPHLLDGLVLSGGCTGMSEAPPEERERFRTNRQVPLDAGQTPADFAPAVVDVIAGPHAGPEIRHELLQSMAAIPADTYRDALNCFTNPPERFDFSRLSMPILMMTGEFDRLASPAEIKGVSQRILYASTRPDMRFEVIPEAGHVCNIEQPAHYNRLLMEFLGRISR